MSGSKQKIAVASESDDQSIKIRAGAKRNGLTILMGGGLALLFASLLLAWLPKSLYLVGIFAFSAAIVTLLIGWFKIREPQFSFELTHSHILYSHRHGSWQLQWDNVQRIDVPKVYVGLQHSPLEMVGIKIKDYQPLLDSISLRLATNLLLEQRPLLLQNTDCATGGCYNNDLIESDLYKTAEGKVIKGIPAMLANRMTKLRASLGYDLYISVADIDRSGEEFVELLRACQLQVNQTP